MLTTLIRQSLYPNMVKSSLFIALFALLSAPTSTNAQLSRIFDVLVESVCQRVVGFISSEDGLLDCFCEASFTVRDGLTMGVDCAFNRPRCLGPVCGSATVQSVVTPRGIKNATFCLSFGRGLAGLGPPPLCLTTEGGGVFGAVGTLKSCGISVGDEECSCNVCDGGRSVAFDCSMLEVETPTLLPNLSGPKLGRCVEPMSPTPDIPEVFVEATAKSPVYGAYDLDDYYDNYDDYYM